MSYDEYGQQYLTENELIRLIHANPNLDLSKVLLDKPQQFNKANASLYAGYSKIEQYKKPNVTVEEFDKQNQANWNMPNGYKKLDIIDWLVAQCKTQDEITRVAEELELYSGRGLLPLLQFLKYMVDTFRNKGIVWGVGRGSSVSSYVLYLIGVHKINSMKFDLDISEFLR